MNNLQKTFSLEKRPTTFRINTLLSSHNEVESELEKNSISYTKLNFPEDCYLLDDKFTESDLWKLDIYKLGKIYIQGISSQIPPLIFTHSTPLKILDACAAPGSKTSQLAALYPDAEIYAFEPNKIRYEKMSHNLNKLGCENVKAIHDSIENISEYILQKEYFDMMLIDVPCSGEGALSYHNKKFLGNWSLSHIKKNYKRQKSICDSVLPYLSSGGEMIYSTCTIAPEENEGVIHYLLCHYPELQLRGINIETSTYLDAQSALKKFEKYIFKTEISEKSLRVIPSKYSEGFFITKFIKKEAVYE